MRPISQEVYGIPRERVIGSSTTLAWEPDEGGGRIVRNPELDVVDDGPAKPVRIWSRVGRRPLLAAGKRKAGAVGAGLDRVPSAAPPGRPGQPLQLVDLCAGGRLAPPPFRCILRTR
jgi:hypothetical protein